MNLTPRAAWARAYRNGQGIKAVMTKPHSDGRARFFVGCYTAVTVMIALTVTMNLLRPSHFSLFWLAGSCVLAAFYVTLLVWSVQGLLYRRELRNVQRRFEEICVTFEY